MLLLERQPATSVDNPTLTARLSASRRECGGFGTSRDCSFMTPRKQSQVPWACRKLSAGRTTSHRGMNGREYYYCFIRAFSR